MGSRTASLLRGPDAQQRLLPGARSRNPGVLRAVPHRARIAESGRVVAALPGIAGARQRRRHRTYLYAGRGLEGMGSSRRLARAPGAFSAESARIDSQAFETAVS